MLPVKFEADGQMWASARFGDFPQYVPTAKVDDPDSLFAGWMLLSYHKSAIASSTMGKFAADRVTLLVRGGSLSKSMSEYLIAEIQGLPNVSVRLGVELIDGDGDRQLEAIVVHDRSTGMTERIPTAGLFVLIGAEPRTDRPDSISYDF